MSRPTEPRKSFSRRDALRILAVGGLTAGAFWKLRPVGRGAAPPVTRARTLMGTSVHLTVLGDDREAAEAAADTTLGRMAELEGLLSRYRDDSEVGRLNASGVVTEASAALLDVLRLSERIAGLGDGAFDITIQPVLDLYRQTLETRHELPAETVVADAMQRVGGRRVRVEGRRVTAEPGTRITLDGIAKGYVVDNGVDVLKQRGFPNVFVEAGGDLLAAGDKGDGVPWRVGIRNPRLGLAGGNGMGLIARFDARERAVATSGDYMQPLTPDFTLHHILDPRTGRSAPELASSTVIAPDAATADGLATLTMVLGPRRGRELLEGLPDCEGCFVSKNLEITRTTGFATV